MRRLVSVAAASGALVLLTAGTALGAHCINESKPNGAGQHTILLIVDNGPPIVVGGKLTGGFIDVYVDADDSGTWTNEDFIVEDDVFIVANHSRNANPAQGVPAVLPPIDREADPGGSGRGIGVAD